jgi:hypothetical protein
MKTFIGLILTVLVPLASTLAQADEVVKLRANLSVERCETTMLATNCTATLGTRGPVFAIALLPAGGITPPSGSHTITVIQDGHQFDGTITVTKIMSNNAPSYFVQTSISVDNGASTIGSTSVPLMKKINPTTWNGEVIRDGGLTLSPMLAIGAVHQ